MKKSLLKTLQEETQHLLALKDMGVIDSRGCLYNASTVHLKRLVKCLNKQATGNDLTLKEYATEIESWLEQKDWWLVRGNAIKEHNMDNTRPPLSSAEGILYDLGNKFLNKKDHITNHTEILRLCFFALANENTKKASFDFTLEKVLALWPHTIDHESIRNSQIAKKDRKTKSPLSQYIKEIIINDPKIKAKDIEERLKLECNDPALEECIIDEYDDNKFVWFKGNERKTLTFDSLKGKVSRIKQEIKLR
ncbi:hypothetical protein [Psychromonas hadalis]|uniref:hypothetical protein n=1 Tax=Psychromonas hadalis TaxID=211669 RepID=UPI0003B69A9A|nr:hypothetical protein [Psychromonas hadalis]